VKIWSISKIPPRTGGAGFCSVTQYFRICEIFEITQETEQHILNIGFMRKIALSTNSPEADKHIADFENTWRSSFTSNAQTKQYR
jgi:hypothetical protein